MPQNDPTPYGLSILRHLQRKAYYRFRIKSQKEKEEAERKKQNLRIELYG